MWSISNAAPRSATPRELAASNDHARSFHAKDGPQTFATGEEAVAHRAMDGMRQRIGRGEKSFEGRVGAGVTPEWFNRDRTGESINFDDK